MSDTLDRSNQSLLPATLTSQAQARVTQGGVEKVINIDPSALKSLAATTYGIGYVTGVGGTGTEASNAVTVSTLGGTITTSSLSTTAGAEYVITVTNTLVAATDVPIVAIKAYAGAGTPQATVTKVAAGSFEITITNLHASSALNAALTINFAIFRSVAA